MTQFDSRKPQTTWTLIKAYWQSEEKAYVYFATGVIFLMTITLVGFDVAFTYWYNYFYNALQDYQARTCAQLMLLFFAMAAVFIIIQVYRYYITQKFALRWRKWLTNELISRWLAKRGYYYLENFDEKTDNPDQRIQEDAGGIVTSSIDLTVGLLTAVTTFPAFVYMLWGLSGVMTLPLGPLGTWHIHGYLVWVSIIYNLIGTFIAFKIGKPLISLNFEQQRREATFRFAAIDLRSHAENVALYHGEKQQESTLKKIFGEVLSNWYQIILRQKKLLWFTGSYNQAAVALPLLAALPNYFNRVFELGGLMQTLRAFTSVQESMSYLVNSYTQIAQWRAISKRLTTFLNHLEEVEVKAERRDKVVFHEQLVNSITANEVTIKTPQNELLLGNINQEFKHGENYLIKGESGIGKSTFLRTLSGIWPYAEGEIKLPKKQYIMFLPQKPYMPIGSLAQAILFPDTAEEVDSVLLEKVLRECHLDHLIPRLNEIAAWSEQLSPGEQQRIAFARVLLRKPDWVILDESTSMVDLKNEEYLYKLLKEQLPNCSIISVGHRPSLEALHDHVINMTKYSYQRRLNEANAV